MEGDGYSLGKNPEIIDESHAAHRRRVKAGGSTSMPKIEIEIPSYSKGPVYVPIPVETLWMLYSLLADDEVTFDQAVEMAMVGWRLYLALVDYKTDPSEYHYRLMGRLLPFPKEYPMGKTLEEQVISFTYHLLCSQHLTREGAARVANKLLKPRDPYTTNTWRMRVDRWAERNHLGKVGLRERKRQEKGKD